MKSATIIVQQWNGTLGYELQPATPEHPPDLLSELLYAGLNMYITRYVSTRFTRVRTLEIYTNGISYYVNPHMRDIPMYLTVNTPKRPPVPSSPNYSYRGRTSTSGNGTNVMALGCLVGDCKQSPCTINRHPTVLYEIHLIFQLNRVVDH